MTPGRVTLGSWLALAGGQLAFANLVWWLGHALAVSGWRPMEGTAARVAVIAVVLLLPQGLVWLRHWRARQQAVHAAQGADALDSIVDRALLSLQTQPGLAAGGWRGAWQQLWQGPTVDPMLRLPWVLVLGLPGAHARRALMRDGYALPALVERAPEPPCTWCITPTAVLVLVSETVLTDDPAATWRRLLQRLQQARPLQPVSAVLLLMPAPDDPGRPGADEPATLWSTAPARLAELSRIAGMVPPLHLAMTGCDRLTGWPEDGLRQILRARVQMLPLAWPQPPAANLLSQERGQLRRQIDEQVLAPQDKPPYVPRHLQRQRTFATAAFAGTLIVLLALAAGWLFSRAQNLDLIDQQTSALDEMQGLLTQAQPALVGGDTGALLPVLERLQQAGQATVARPWLPQLGLSQQDKLRSHANLAHRRLLREGLAPVLVRRLESEMTAELAGTEPPGDPLYLGLQAYLHLLQGGALATSDFAGLESRLADLSGLAADRRPALTPHLQLLLAGSGVVQPQAVNAALVADVRRRLNTQPLAFWRERQFHRAHADAQTPPLSLLDVVGPADARLFNRRSGKPAADGIERLYTADGIQRFVAPVAAQPALVSMRRLLGLAPLATSDVATAEAVLLADALKIYVGNYAAAWEALLADLRVAPVGDARAAEHLASRLTAVDSPIRALINRAVENTRAGQRLAQLSDQIAPALLNDRFDWLQRLVIGQPPPLDQAPAQMAGLVMASVRGAASGSSAADTAVSLPRPLQDWMADYLSPSAASPAAAAADYAALRQQCGIVATGRYPLVLDAKSEMGLEDFGQLFGHGVGFDTFFDRWLAQWVDTSTTPWRWRYGMPGQPPLPIGALASFQQAARIRAAFFAPDSAQPSLTLQVSTEAVDPAIQAVELRLNKLPVRLQSSAAPATVNWPGQPPLQSIRLVAVGIKAPALAFEGPWSLLRLLDAMSLRPTRTPERYRAVIDFGGRQVVLNVQMNSVQDGNKQELRQFRCPS
jgi:type VI secretion system protein ImpL